MKTIISLLAIISFNVFAGLQDVPVIVIDNTTAKTNSGMRVGFIINDDHPKFEVKQETTYSNNNGVISVRTSNGDNNEETMHVDLASQKELEAERQLTNSQINHVSDLALGSFNYAQQVDEDSKKRDASLQLGINKTNQVVKQAIDEGDRRMTKAEKELYSTTALSKSNAQGIAGNRKAIAETNKRIDKLALEVSDLRDDMYRGVASAMAVGTLPTAPAGKYGFVAGVGTYGSHEAVAVGFSASGESVSFKAGVTYDKEEVGAAASIGYWF